MYSNILNTLKALSVIIFFSVLSYEIVDLTKFTKTVIIDTQKQSLQQITDLRKDTFAYLDNATNKIDNRIGFVQRDILRRVDVNASGINNQLTVAIEDVNSQLSTVNSQLSTALINVNDHLNKIDMVAESYAELPLKITTVLHSKFGIQTNCTINELCWQNMTTDLLIDSRNVVRDGSKTFRLINSNIPTLMTNVNSISSTVATTFPPIAISVQQTADHIQKITKPHWYDRVISYGISGGMLYFTAHK